ncbi:unnamed protein product [Camellia sinensis]
MDIRFRFGSFLTPHNLWSTFSRIQKPLIKPCCSSRRDSQQNDDNNNNRDFEENPDGLWLKFQQNHNVLTKESKHCIQSDRENVPREKQTKVNMESDVPSFSLWVTWVKGSLKLLEAHITWHQRCISGIVDQK